MPETKLSIVVPCYNESKNIPLILERFAVAVAANPAIPAEVVLVNNGSTDDSAAVFAEYLPKYPFATLAVVSQNQGYGFGIMSGLRVAHGEVLSWTHADMQTDPMDVFIAYQYFVKVNQPNSIIVKGKRVGRKFGDWAFTFGMSCIASIVLSKALYDINAQPKLFHRSLLTKLQNPPNDFSLDLYLLYMAKRLGYGIRTIPVRFSKRLHGESKWAFSFSSKYKTVLRTIKYIFALRRAL